MRSINLDSSKNKRFIFMYLFETFTAFYKPAGGHVVLVDLTFPVNAEAGEAVGTRDGHSRVETFSVIHNPGVWKDETRNQRHKVRTIKGFLLLIYILLYIDL